LTHKAFAERGFHEAAVLTDWPAIVGDALADQCAAIQLDHNGTLVVRAEGPTATRLQHLEPQILDRIATYFGFRAVKRLTLRQGPVAGRQPPPRTARIDCPEPPDSLESELENVPDEALREALLRLGSRIASADEDA
jgi:hypothetical protein